MPYGIGTKEQAEAAKAKHEAALIGHLFEGGKREVTGLRVACFFRPEKPVDGPPVWGLYVEGRYVDRPELTAGGGFLWFDVYGRPGLHA